MSEAKFTKGRWAIDKYKNLVDRFGNNVQIKACLSVPIAGHTEEHTANAHLIASAPEMYEMLQALLDAEGIIKQPHNRKAVKKLLAKARGEEV